MTKTNEKQTVDELKSVWDGAMSSIEEMVKGLNSKSEKKQEEARETINQDPLSVEVRSPWYSPGEKTTPSEYKILLSTGGPASHIIGQLDEHGQPETAVLEVQDWFKPWTSYHQTDEQNEALLAYASCFYFEEC